ncbi:hypothetical protein [Paenibacillus sp. GSMTC-2017]|nr:hypothetical protein [Paenibacillus sp. GSMTC-2017]
MKKRTYKPLDDLSAEEIQEQLKRNQLDELIRLPFSVGEKSL